MSWSRKKIFGIIIHILKKLFYHEIHETHEDFISSFKGDKRETIHYENHFKLHNLQN